MLHFRSGANAMIASKIIFEVYKDVLKVNKYQNKKFSNGNIDLPNSEPSGCPIKFDNNALKSLVRTDPKLSIQEIPTGLRATSSTV